jgi:acyl-CoA synthetase (AMP-forming)/AMP-acid ligase II
MASVIPTARRKSFLREFPRGSLFRETVGYPRGPLKETASGVTEAELCAFLEKRFARGQVPDAFVFVEELPHTSTPKVAA